MPKVTKKKKKIGNKTVRPYLCDGVYNIGDILLFPGVRDHEEPGVIHEGVYGVVVDIASHQDQHSIMVSFADLEAENKGHDPGRAMRRFVASAPADQA